MTVITSRFTFILGKNSTIHGFQNLWLKPRTGRIKENLYFLFIQVESMSFHFRFHKVRMEKIFIFNVLTLMFEGTSQRWRKICAMCNLGFSSMALHSHFFLMRWKSTRLKKSKQSTNILFFLVFVAFPWFKPRTPEKWGIDIKYGNYWAMKGTNKHFTF